MQAVGLEGRQHGDKLQEDLAYADSLQVFITLHARSSHTLSQPSGGPCTRHYHYRAKYRIIMQLCDTARDSTLPLTPLLIQARPHVSANVLPSGLGRVF